jgi:hypothetical protein
VIGVSAEAETSHQKEKVYRRSQMPKDFQLTPGRKAYAEAKGLNGRIPEVWEAFCLHHQSKGSVMVDWDKAWMKWVLNDVRFNPPGKSDAGYPRGEQPADEERLEARMSEIAKRKGLLP